MHPEELHISALFSKDEKYTFEVPSYQREYTWDKKNWSDLFDTIANNQNEDFIGSIILVPTDDFFKTNVPVNPWEVIDGQQRLTTLSIFFCALLTEFEKHESKLEPKSSEFDDLSQLRSFIVLNIKGKETPRITLQDQGNNNDLYLMLLRHVGFKVAEKSVPYGVRRSIFRAYYFFIEKINEFISDYHRHEEWNKKELTDDVYIIDELFSKVKQLLLIKIHVDDRSEAINIFGALNSTGVPLSAVDLIKTDILKLSESDEYDVESWSNLMDNIKGPDEKINDRFFRQFLNAFKNDYSAKYGLSFEKVITSSNVYASYQTLFKKHIEIKEEMYNSGTDYSYFLTLNKYENTKELDYSDLNDALFDLYKAEGTPSYILLLNLFKKKEEYKLSKSHLTGLIQFLIKFFVRRNFTDTPPTRDLINLFIAIVKGIEDTYSGDDVNPEDIMSYIEERLRASTTSLDKLIEVFMGPIYEDNKNATRFILSYLIRKNGDNESKDPWSRVENGNLQWTIEHILPQTDNLSNEWVEMISKKKPSGDERTDKEYAADVQAKYVHTLGNLTLTGYNSTLSARPFLEKRDYKDKNGNPIGYNNGFWLNKDLKDESEWNEESIKKRTTSLISSIVELIKFDDEYTPDIEGLFVKEDE